MTRTIVVDREVEVWKDIPGLERKYEVSVFGEIRNLRTGKILKPQNNGNDYLCVYIRVNKKLKSFYIHRCVLSAFNPTENQEKLQVDHIDFNRSNNNFGNLRWVSIKENLNHSIINGRMENAHKEHSKLMKNKVIDGTNPFLHLKKEDRKKATNKRKNDYYKEKHPFFGKYGEGSSNHKLTNEKVSKIRKLVELGRSMLSVSKEMNISYSAVWSIINNKTWKWVK